MKQTGFTLAELLIALALLGIIAAFTIPKVLQSSSTQETNAKLRETVASLENAWNDARSTNNITYGQPLYDTIAPRLNTVSSAVGVVIANGAPLNGVIATHPCRELPTNSGWVLFANGVVVSGLASGTNLDALPFNDLMNHDEGDNYVLCIDVNGAASPNLPGQDVFIGNFNQYGAFNATPTLEYEALRSFRWGNASGTHVIDTGTAVVATPTHGAIGNSAGNPCALVGCRLVQ